MLLLGLLLAGCDDTPCEDMTRSPGGLRVTAEEHPTGWGEPACDACHQRQAIHRTACTPGIDLQAVRAEVARDPTNAVCTECHGDNRSVP